MRTKRPRADLKRQYRKTVAASTGITLLLHVSVTVAFPSFSLEGPAPVPVKPPVIIHLEDIPETRQIRRPPPPPRPVVPIEADVEDLPDDVTIESTELAFDRIAVNLPSLRIKTGALAPLPVEEEEIFDFESVEEKPELIHPVLPQYPPAALRAGREGTVYIRFVVDKNGKVKNPQVVRGPGIFQRPALEAVSQFLFTPALQGGEKVQVRMGVPIEFRLNRSR